MGESALKCRKIGLCTQRHTRTVVIAWQPKASKDGLPACYLRSPWMKRTRQIGWVLLEALSVKVMPSKCR